jgi:hypothetical protein
MCASWRATFASPAISAAIVARVANMLSRLPAYTPVPAEVMMRLPAAAGRNTVTLASMSAAVREVMAKAAPSQASSSEHA